MPRNANFSDRLLIKLIWYSRSDQMQTHLNNNSDQTDVSSNSIDSDITLDKRLPENRRQGSPIPPDLAAEVISPSESQYDIIERHSLI